MPKEGMVLTANLQKVVEAAELGEGRVAKKTKEKVTVEEVVEESPQRTRSRS